MKVNSLSVIIITHNEAKNIVSCLESVKFATEIIILDSGSQDDTVKFAQHYTDKIFPVDWPGYGPQKNRALEKATCDWVLSIDADEMITPNLQQEIQAILSSHTPFKAYSIPRKSRYCKQIMRHGDWKNDRCLRLFRRGTARFTEVPVHEALIVQGATGYLKGHLLHNAFTNLEEVLYKLDSYSTLSAEYKFAHGQTSSLLTAISHGFWTFFRGYFLKLGFLDGKKGLILAISNAEGCYYRYLKMMLLQEQKSK